MKSEGLEGLDLLRDYYDVIVELVTSRVVEENSTAHSGKGYTLQEEIDEAVKRVDDDLYNQILGILQTKLREVSVDLQKLMGIMKDE